MNVLFQAQQFFDGFGLEVRVDLDRNELNQPERRDTNIWVAILLQEGPRDPKVLLLFRVLRKLADAGAAVDGPHANLQHHRVRPSLLHSGVVDGDLLVRCRAHEGPVGEAAAPRAVQLVEGARKLDLSAESPVQLQTRLKRLSTGDFLYCGRQDKYSGCEEVAIFLQCIVFSLRPLTKNCVVHEIHRASVQHKCDNLFFSQTGRH
mmetsp:Transcript_5410/g.17525  ORF Transcript_5410/g.17525 Transcript_5410/m.17525 type:complete len:205 (+) Transcript_5410:2463-3077(+)